MSTHAAPIDLSRLPPPSVVEPLDYEAILASLIGDVRSLFPDFSADLESDPVQKVLESFAYRELLGRQRSNDAARSVMLAYATGSDLEPSGGPFGSDEADHRPRRPRGPSARCADV